MAETGMEHKLPDDFIPFAPGVQQRQGATHERPQGSQEGTAKPAQSGNSKADKSAAWKQKKARNAQKTQASSTVSAGSASVGTSSARVQRTESIRGPRIREMGPDEELEESDEDDIHQEENDDEVFPLANETIQVRPGEKIRLPKHLSRSGESEDEDGDSEEDEEVSGLWALQIFDAVIWTVPFGFLLLLLGILIKQQYALEPTFLGEVFEQSTNFPCTSINQVEVTLSLPSFLSSLGRFPPSCTRRRGRGVPGVSSANQQASLLTLVLGVFVYFTMFSPSTSRERMVQAALFLLSIAAGSSFLYILERVCSIPYFPVIRPMALYSRFGPPLTHQADDITFVLIDSMEKKRS